MCSILVSGCCVACSAAYWFVSNVCRLSLFFPLCLSLCSQKAFGGTTAPHYWSRNSMAASKKSCPSVSSSNLHDNVNYVSWDAPKQKPHLIFLLVLFDLLTGFIVLYLRTWLLWKSNGVILHYSPLKHVAIRWTLCMRPWGLGRHWRKKPRGPVAQSLHTETR